MIQNSATKNKPASKNELIAGLDAIPDDWEVVALNGAKRPVHEVTGAGRQNWQIEHINRDDIIKGIRAGRVAGYGLKSGPVSGGLVAVDCDGGAAHDLAETLGGLPTTVSWSSGKPGRAQYLYRIPDSEWLTIQNKKLRTGQQGPDGKDVLLELRWSKCQSVLPPSVHPETGRYHWLQSPNDCSIAPAPDWVLNEMRINHEPAAMMSFQKSSDDLELARLALSHLPIYTPGKNTYWDLFYAMCGVVNDLGGDGERLLIEWDGGRGEWGCSIESKIDSIKKSPPSSPRGLGSLFYYASQYGWIDPRKSSRNHSPRENTKRNIIDLATHRKSSNDEYLQAVKNLSEIGKSSVALTAAIQSIAAEFNRNSSDVFRLYKAFSDEIERDLGKSEIKKSLDELIEAESASLNVADYLPGQLSQIIEFCRRLNLRPECGLMEFFATVSGILPVGSKIDLCDYSSYSQSLGIYYAMIAQVSQKKSPLKDHVSRHPLQRLQDEAKLKYIRALSEWNEKMKNLGDGEEIPPKPQMEQYFLDRCTPAALRNILSDLFNGASPAKHGIILQADELSGELKNQKKTYNIGLAEDLLSYYDGRGKREALASQGDKMAGDFSECLISVSGSIQPDVIGEFMNGKLDGNGQWARFCFVNQPNTATKIPEKNRPAKIDLRPMLTDFYQKISQLEKFTLRLSPEAEDLFVRAYNRCEEKRITEPRQSLAAQWGKMPGKIGRFAAIIHITQAVWLGCEVTHPVTEDCVELAIKLAKFLMGEVKALYASTDTEDLASHLKQILDLSRRVGFVSAREVKQGCWGLRAKSPDEIRDCFVELTGLGYGKTAGQGKRLKFSVEDFVEGVEVCRERLNNSNPPTSGGFSGSVEIVEKKIKKISTPTHTQKSTATPIEMRELRKKNAENLNNLNKTAETPSGGEFNPVEARSTDSQQNPQQNAETPDGTGFDNLNKILNKNLNSFVEGDCISQKHPWRIGDAAVYVNPRSLRDGERCCVVGGCDDYINVVFEDGKTTSPDPLPRTDGGSYITKTATETTNH